MHRRKVHGVGGAHSVWPCGPLVEAYAEYDARHEPGSRLRVGAYACNDLRRGQDVDLGRAEREEVLWVPHMVNGLSSAPRGRCAVWECTMCVVLRRSMVSSSSAASLAVETGIVKAGPRLQCRATRDETVCTARTARRACRARKAASHLAPSGADAI